MQKVLVRFEKGRLETCRKVTRWPPTSWRKRGPCLHSREDALLAEKVKEAFQDNRCVYGSPRIHADLRAQGLHCARNRLARLM